MKGTQTHPFINPLKLLIKASSVSPQPESFYLKRSSHSHQDDINNNRINHQTQIANIRKQINQYLDKQQMIDSTYTVYSKNKRNIRHIRDYLARLYSKDKKSEIVKKNIIIEQQPEAVIEKNRSFQIKQFKPRRKGCNPYNVGANDYNQVFKNTHSNVVTPQKRHILLQTNNKSRNRSFAQNKQKNYEFLFAHLVPQKIKRYKQEQYNNFLKNRNLVMKQQSKQVQLQPWAKDSEQFSIFDL